MDRSSFVQILDDAALYFTRHFYMALFSGHPVDSSFTIAKEALRCNAVIEGCKEEQKKFLLLPKSTPPPSPSSSSSSRSLHAKWILSNPMDAQWPPCPEYITIGSERKNVEEFEKRINIRDRRPPQELFEGRELLLHNLLGFVSQHRLVSLVGGDRVGKSTVAMALCHLVYDREIVCESIVYFDAVEARDYESMLSQLQQCLLISPLKVNQLQSIMIQTSPRCLDKEEKWIVDSLSSTSMLLVIDHIEAIPADSLSSLRVLIQQLLSRNTRMKILVVMPRSKLIEAFAYIALCWIR